MSEDFIKNLSVAGNLEFSRSTENQKIQMSLLQNAMREMLRK